MNDTVFLSRERRQALLAALIGAAVATWVIFLNHGYINSDGLVYIESAKQFSLGNWQQGLSVYNWPFYSLIIATIHQTTGLGLLNAAHVITIFAFALLAAGLPLLVRELGGNHRVQMFSVLMLIGATPLVGNYLPMVIRDHGFLAAHVWSLVFLLRFFRSNSLYDALAWNAIATLATLFRIEGIVYFILLPLLTLFRKDHSTKENIIDLVKANAFLIVGMTLLITALYFIPHFDLQHLGRLGDPANIAQRVFHQINDGLNNKADSYGTILGPFLDDYAMQGLILTLACILVVKSLSSVGIAQLLLSISLWKRHYEYGLKANNLIFLSLLSAICIINATCILISSFALPKRYLQPLGLVIIILASFSFYIMLDDWKRGKGKRWILPILSTILAVQIALNLKPVDPRNRFEQEAAQWIHEHLPPGSKIYYDYGRIRYYAEGDSSSRHLVPWDEIERLISSDDIIHYDYLVVHIPKKDYHREQVLENRFGKPLATFENKRGKRISIYQIQPINP